MHQVYNIFILSRNSTCFGHLMCPSSGVISRTRGNFYVSCKLYGCCLSYELHSCRGRYGNSASIAASQRATSLGFNSVWGLRFISLSLSLSLSLHIQTDTEPQTQTTSETWIHLLFFQWTNQPVRKAEYLNVIHWVKKIRKRCKYTSTPPYTFMTCCLNKHTGNTACIFTYS